MDNVDLFIKERVEMNETLSLSLNHLSSEKFMFVSLQRDWRNMQTIEF